MKIDQSLFHYFEKAGTKVLYHPQDIIYMQEDTSNSLFLILKGKVRVYQLTSSGDEVTFDILDQGRVFGESSFFQNSTRPTTVEAMSEVELISCQLENLYPYFAQSQDLTLSLFSLMTQTVDHLTNLLKRSYTYNRFEKMASFLLEQKSDILLYTHENIASMVGLSRVTVTSILNDFQKKNYIELKYRKIIIKDKEGLSTFLNQ